ncbi:hypothetical protein HDV05_004305 [Chytridiales sp. JEL 0842]|nr:hypothetical protein HDV05_004305 [Chytridiales sp. JEL 0842]
MSENCTFALLTTSPSCQTTTAQHQINKSRDHTASMTPTFDDLVANPHPLIQSLVKPEDRFRYEEVGEITQKFKQALLQSAGVTNEDEALAKVPSVNTLSSKIKNKSFVHFRGMVQDNGISPEYYIPRHTIKLESTGETRIIAQHFMDELPLDESENYTLLEIPRHNQFCQKTPVVCAAAPGQTSWTRNVDESMTDLADTILLSKCGNSRIKNKLASIANDDPHAVAVVVKFYGDEPEDIKLFKMFDFYGILETNAEDFMATEDSMDGEWEIEEKGPAVVALPKLHCLLYKPATDVPSLEISRHLVPPANFQQVTKAALNYLQGFLNGDRLAAEYLLSHLTSRIRFRRPELNGGFFPLNITGLETSAAVSDLYSAISNLLPRVRHLPLGIEWLNKAQFAPGMNANSNSLGLTSGILQAPDQTWFVVNEVGMDSGDLKTGGVMNMKYLSKVFLSATVPVVVATGGAEMVHENEVDFGLLVLSESKSMFPVDCILPLRETSGEAVRLESSVPLESIRHLIAMVKYNTDYHVSDKMSEVVNNDFLKIRKDCAARNEKPYTQDDLLFRLELARIISLLNGRTELDEESWKYAGEMESQRQVRLSEEAAKIAAKAAQSNQLSGEMESMSLSDQPIR